MRDKNMARPSEYNLPSAGPLQRSTSASAAFLIVVTALVVFQYKQHQHINGNATQRESQLIWFHLPSPLAPQIPTHKEDTTPAALPQIKKSKPEPTSMATIPAAITVSENPSQLETKNDFDDAFKSQKALDHAVDQTMTNKSAGIDSTSIKRAYQDSKSELQKQAEKNGTPLADARLTQQEKFQQAANRAAKPDCLRQGGSILSLFVVAYQVATDHCK